MCYEFTRALRFGKSRLTRTNVAPFLCPRVIYERELINENTEKKVIVYAGRERVDVLNIPGDSVGPLRRLTLDLNPTPTRPTK
jgi:hypothetical protein